MSNFVRINKSIIFKNFITGLNQYAENLNLNFLEEGIKINTLTLNKSGFLDILLTKDMFEDYDHEIDTTYGINLSILNKCLKSVKKEDKLIIKFEIENTLVNIQNNRRTLKFIIPTLDIDEDEMEIPKINYNNIIYLSNKRFKDICSEFKNHDIDSISLNIEKEKLIFCSKSSVEIKMEMNEYKEEIEKCGDIKIIKKDINNYYRIKKLEDNSKVTIPFNDFNKFSKIEKFSKKIKLSFSNDFPINLIYKMIDGSYISLYLAPRIE